MNKKIIILVLVILLILNTLFWTNLIIHSDDWRISVFPDGSVRYSGGERFGGYAVKNIITLLAITDAVLVAISFMVIFLYKKDQNLDI